MGRGGGGAEDAVRSPLPPPPTALLRGWGGRSGGRQGDTGSSRVGALLSHSALALSPSASTTRWLDLGE